jgi:hypothetical protein
MADGQRKDIYCDVPHTIPITLAPSLYVDHVCVFPLFVRGVSTCVYVPP